MPRWLLILLFILGGEAAATRVFHQRLDQVLCRDTPVIRARLTATRVEIEPNLLRVPMEVTELEVVNGLAPPGNHLLYQFSTMLERQVDGKTVRVSPIRDGSGIEQQLQVNQYYYFLLDSSRAYVIRVEPDSSGDTIRKLLEKART